MDCAHSLGGSYSQFVTNHTGLFCLISGLIKSNSYRYQNQLEHSCYVGYQTQDSNGKPYNTVGAMFVSVNGSGDTFRMNDIKMTCNGQDGGAYQQNILQMIDPATSRVDDSQTITYYGVADGASEPDDPAGWYYMDESSVGELSFPIGQAFLCGFDPSLNAKLIYAGAVLQENVTIDTVVNEAALPYMYVVNPLAMDIPINRVKMICNGSNDGGAYQQNILQTIDPVTSRVDDSKTITYYGVADGASEPDDPAGWYYMDETSAEDVVWKSGDGFLCGFDPSFQAKLVFLNPLAE